MNYRKTKNTCFFTYLAMSPVFSLPPVLFITFHDLYDISYTLLGTLVLVNFCTQLSIDLIFTFFAKHFNIKKTVRIMPLITTLGLTVYALVPTLFPQYAYAGLVAGTIIFSVAAGLCEVLLSPIVAAIPSDNPQRDMSKLHSLYAYGVLSVVIISTVYLKLFGTENWAFLPLFLALFPIISHFLFCTSPLPDVSFTKSEDANGKKSTATGLTLFFLCIFFGSATENAMTNWISGYVENALGISKALGDILGLALFAVLLGLMRTWYAKRGKNIYVVMVVSMSGAIVCYLIAGLVSNAVIALIACALMGLCTSMLWPGTLIMMEERLPNLGVVAYALMAVGGDFGASVSPQLLGIVADKVSAGTLATLIAAKYALTTEQVGLKAGMLTATVFPIIGVIILIIIGRYFAQRKNELPLSMNKPD